MTITKGHVLVAGLHRIEACKRLGWTRIPAFIVDMDDRYAELAEIDENLVRTELTALERSEQILRRKAIYEELFPESQARSSEKQKQRSTGRPRETVSPGFSADTAAKTGQTARTVQQDVQIGSNLMQELRDAIRGTPLADRKRDLLVLARLPEDKQKEIVALMTGGQANSFADARRTVCSKAKGPAGTTGEAAPANGDEEAAGSAETTTPTLPPPVLSMDRLTEEARVVVDAVKAQRNDPALSRGDRLVSIGHAAILTAFDDDTSAAFAAAIDESDHPLIAVFADMVGCTTSEVWRGILAAMVKSRSDDEEWARLTGAAQAKAA